MSKIKAILLLSGLFLYMLFPCKSYSLPKKIKTENFIGLEYPARLENRAPIFNGNFKLGIAGFGLNRLQDSSIAFTSNIPDLKIEKKENGKDVCLKIESVEGSPRFILTGREVYIPKKMKLKFTFNAKLAGTPKTSDKMLLRVDFRHVNPGKIRDSKKKYSISGGAFRLTDKWKKYVVNVRAPKAGYYKYFFFTELSAENSLPTLLLDSISLNPYDGNYKPQAQVAIYADKKIPVYMKGEKVKYKVKTFLPGVIDKSPEIELVFYNDQSKKIIIKKKISLQKDSGDIFSGQTAFAMPEYGPCAPIVRFKGKRIDSFGGETLILHPGRQNKNDEIAFRLGANFHSMLGKLRGQSENDKRIFWNSSPTHSATIEDQFKIMKFAGLKVNVVFLRWLDLEPEKGKWNFSNYDKMFDLYKKHKIKIIGILGPRFCINKRTGKPMDVPAWIVEYSKKHKLTSLHWHEGYMPAEDLWIKYCKQVTSRYKDTLIALEVFGEPRAWCTPEEYMIYLKSAKKAVKSVAPEIPILGPCPTGDGNAPRFIGWSKSILALGGEKYLDGFSYHPYGASNDFQVGDYFEATDLIKKVKKMLKNPKIGLWNLECFQHSNSKYKRCDRWDASTALRHYLISLGNGVKMVAPYDLYELRRDRLNPHVRVITPWVFEEIPAPVTAALNFLSYGLKDTTKSKVINVNSFARTYMFSNKSGEYALGVAWYLRPGGCQWILSGKNKNINFFDMFGNKLKNIRKRKLGYNPVYISGTKKEVESCLKNSNFASFGNIIDIKGRAFKDTLFLSAKNNLGKAEKIGIKIEKIPSFTFPELCEFAFAENIYCTAKLPLCLGKNASVKSLKYKTFLAGKHYGNGEIKILPDSKYYDLPFGNKAPLKLVLNKGSEVVLFATRDHLCITAKVKDKDIIAPPVNHLWKGDALEVFVDCNPLSELDSNSAKKVRQYIFSAKPAKDGIAIWDKRNLKYKAVAKSKLTEDGYVIEAKIPWKALLPDSGYFPPMIYGIEIAIDHITPGEKHVQESLSDKKLPSFKQRLHYPLFALPLRLKDNLVVRDVKRTVINGLKNSNLEKKGKRLMPAFWWIQSKWQYGNYGYNGKSGVKLISPLKHTKRMASARQKILCQHFAGKEVIIEMLVKGENLQKYKGTSYNPGLRFFVNFHNKETKINFAPQGIGIKKPLIKSFGWSILQYTAKVPENASHMTVFCGFSKDGCAGELFISAVYVKLAE